MTTSRQGTHFTNNPLRLRIPRPPSNAPSPAHVYAVAYSSDSIVHWDRDAISGALTNQVDQPPTTRNDTHTIARTNACTSTYTNTHTGEQD